MVYTTAAKPAIAPASAIHRRAYVGVVGKPISSSPMRESWLPASIAAPTAAALATSHLAASRIRLLATSSGFTATSSEPPPVVSTVISIPPHTGARPGDRRQVEIRIETGGLRDAAATKIDAGSILSDTGAPDAVAHRQRQP